MELHFEPDLIIDGIYLYDIELNRQRYFSRWEPEQVARYLSCYISEVPDQATDFTITSITGSNTIEVVATADKQGETL